MHFPYSKQYTLTHSLSPYIMRCIIFMFAVGLLQCLKLPFAMYIVTKNWEWLERAISNFKPELTSEFSAHVSINPFQMFIAHCRI